MGREPGDKNEEKCQKMPEGGGATEEVTGNLRERSEESVKEYQRIKNFRTALREKNTASTAASSKSKGSRIEKDSSIKKVNVFLRKLKSLGDFADSADILCEDLKKLKMAKFLSEILSIVFELKISRKREIEAILKIFSQLHREYPQFSIDLEDSLLSRIDKEFKSLKPLPDEIEFSKKLKEFAHNQRKYIRLTTEMVFAGIFKDDAVLVDLLSSLIKKDKKKNKFFIIPALIANFLKYAGEECTGRLPRNLKSDFNRLGKTHFAKAKLLEKSSFEETKKMLMEYYKACSENLCNIDAVKKKKEAESTELLKTKGSLSDKTLDKLQNINEAFGRLYYIVESMSNSLDLKFPEVQKYSDEGIIKKLSRNITKDEVIHLFDDEETRSIYENLTDLSMYAVKVSSQERKKNEIEEKKVKRDKLLKLRGEAESKGSLKQSKKKLSPFDQLLFDMNSATNKSKIDRIAERFCPFESEKNRTKLIEAILGVEMKESGLILFYCRLLATLSRYYPEIKKEVIETLEKRFYGMHFSKGKKNLSDKLKHAIFISELTKFNVFPIGKLSAIIKKSFESFSPHSIQIICAILENCGRWLFRNPVTKEMCQKILKILEKRKGETVIDDYLRTLVDLARYKCNPPPIRKTFGKRLSPEKEFIRFVLLRVLAEGNANEALKLIRKLNWKDPSIRNFVRCSLLRVDNYSFENLPALASIVSALESVHGIGTLIVDDLLEELRLALEDKIPFAVQRRTALARLLGELYVFRVIGATVIFNTLYFLITFSPQKQSQKDRESSAESNGGGWEKSNEFKVRLVCALLESCGKYFKRGFSGLRMDRFLLHFQRFIILSNIKTPIDLDLEFAVEEVIDNLRPKKVFPRSLEEIEAKLKEMHLANNARGDKQDKLIEREEIKRISEINDLESRARRLDPEHDSEGNEEEKLDKNLSSEETESDYERNKQKTEDDEVFEKEFDQTIKESIELHKYKPRKITMSNSASYSNAPNPKKEVPRERKNQSFKLLMKRKGDSKPILKDLEENKEMEFTIRHEDQTKKINERGLLKEGVLKRIIASEMNNMD